MYSVLVTGSAGFIGSNLADKLIADGRTVTGIDAFSEMLYPCAERMKLTEKTSLLPNYRFLRTDIRDKSAMHQAFKESQPQKVVHLAALPGVRNSLEKPQDYYNVNLSATIALLELCREFKVDQFVFGSSSSVYGANCPAPFREDYPADQPVSPYGASKRMAEIACYTFHHLYGLKITCLRFFTVYGPRQRPDLAIYKFFHCIRSGQPLPIYGDGSSFRDYTFVSDIVDGIVAALDRPYDFELINLGCGTPVQLKNIVSLLENQTGKSATLEFMPMPSVDLPLTHADISKAHKLLDYKPKVDVEEGVENFARWFDGQ